MGEQATLAAYFSSKHPTAGTAYNTADTAAIAAVQLTLSNYRGLETDSDEADSEQVSDRIKRDALLKKINKIGVIKAPPPTPVKPTMKPVSAPAKA